MLYTIRNDRMTVTIDEVGAQLMSITGADGTEYLWSGDSAYWANRSPVLFPYVGRLTGEQYTLGGKTYSMGRHGFARNMTFMPVVEEENRMIFGLADSPETRKIYPYAFDFSVTYELEEDTLHVIYGVENRTRATMYFGLGAHPGFRVPLEEGFAFEDYQISFAHPCHASRVLLSENYMNAGRSVPYYLENGTTLTLRHELFDNDAIIFDHMDKSVVLTAPGAKHGVRVHIPHMRYLGLWHTPKTDAPFLCLEPWVSLPSREGIVEDFAQQGDLVALPSGDFYTNQWSIQIF